MRNKFDNELKELKQSLTIMSTLCENAISLAVDSVLEGEQENLERVEKIEDEINDLEKEIERRCLKLLLQQQPVASDLRTISSSLKMITDLERIGDQAVNIAEISKYQSAGCHNIHIRDMTGEVARMVSSAIDAFVRRDLSLAKETILQDDKVDILFTNVKDDIINALKNDFYDPHQALDMLMIAKYLERIGDHAVNLSEWVVFSIIGKHKEE